VSSPEYVAFGLGRDERLETAPVSPAEQIHPSGVPSFEVGYAFQPRSKVTDHLGGVVVRV